MRFFLTLFIVFSKVCVSQQVDWIKTVYYPNITYSSGTAIDPFGNVYLAGDYRKSDPGSDGYYLHKYSSSGTLLWADTSGSCWGVVSAGVVTDQSGNAYIALYAAGTSDSIRIGNVFYPCCWCTYLVKYNSQGQVQWVTGQGGEPRDMAIDSQGFIYVTGFGSGGSFTSKYDQNGNFQQGFWGSYWVNVDALGNVNIPKARFSPLGAVTFTHSYQGKVAGDSFGNTYVSDLGSVGYSALTKIKPSGHLDWQISVPYQGECAIYCDASNNIFVAGIYGTWPSTDGMCLYKYNSSGSEVWYINIPNPVASPPFYYNPLGKIEKKNGIVYFSGFKSKHYAEGFLVKIYDLEEITAPKENTLLSNELSVFPNPSTRFNVQWKSGKPGTIKMKVMDALGKTVLIREIHSFASEIKEEIDLADLPKGIYFLELSDGSNKHIEKLMVE
jgi:hypothetical protein